MKKAEKKKWAKKLSGYWKRRELHYTAFRQKESMLEEEMKRDLGEELEFFYVDGECVGIGQAYYEKRKKFPLFQREDLD